MGGLFRIALGFGRGVPQAERGWGRVGRANLECTQCNIKTLI